MRLAGLIGEQIHRVAGVVPQQMVGPAARLAERVHVGAPEEIGLHVHLLHLEFAGEHALVDPLMARIESSGVAGHRDDAGFLLHLQQALGVRHRVGHRDLDHHVLAGAHALFRLGGVHLRGRGTGSPLPDPAGAGTRPDRRWPVRNLPLPGNLACLLIARPGQRDDFDVRNLRHGLQMLDAERPLAGETDLHEGYYSALSGQNKAGTLLRCTVMKPGKSASMERPDSPGGSGETPKRSAGWRYVANLGPGLITGAADDDPSGISTYSVTGAAFGYSPLWTALFSFPLMAAVQLMCARLGMVTGEGWRVSSAAAIRRWVLWGACALLIVANVVNIGADLGGMARRHGDGHRRSGLCWTPFFAVADRALLFWSSYKLIARVFKWLTLVLFAYVITAFLAQPDWGAVLRATFIPHIEWSSDLHGGAGRNSGHHHLALPVLLAGRAGSGRGARHGPDHAGAARGAPRDEELRSAQHGRASPECSSRTW